LAAVLAGILIAAAIIKLLQSETQQADSRVVTAGQRIRATATDRIADPRAQMLDSVDSAISGAAAEISGSSKRPPSGGAHDA
jgi:hypothetical protein